MAYNMILWLLHNSSYVRWSQSCLPPSLVFSCLVTQRVNLAGEEEEDFYSTLVKIKTPVQAPKYVGLLRAQQGHYTAAADFILARADIAFRLIIME